MKLCAVPIPTSRPLTPPSSSAAVGLEVRSLPLSSLREVPEYFLEMNQEFVKIILQKKDDIWKNQELSDLLDDYFENNRLTLDFFTALDTCLKRAGHIESNVSLRKFEEEHNYAVLGEGSVKNYSRTLDELRNFRGAADPFTQELFEVFSSVYSKQILTLERLQAKKRKLDKKLGKLKSRRRVSNVIFVVTFASVLIGTVVAAAGVPLRSTGRSFKSIWEKFERDLMGQREIISSMQVGTYTVIKNLVSTRELVDRFQIKIEALLANEDFMRDGEAVVIAVEDSRKKVDDVIKTTHDLNEHVNKCTQETRMARTLILRRIINNPSSSNQDNGMSS
ncbi:hypothetical protein Pfo_019481 [Paulownia fortunei]|nr:hypothetical protein Pfo_019481 [Paulownia fortunei]